MDHRAWRLDARIHLDGRAGYIQLLSEVLKFGEIHEKNRVAVAEDNKMSSTRTWQAGDIYSFKIFSDAESRRNQRYAALKILGVKDRLGTNQQVVCFVALAGVFEHQPEFSEVEGLSYLINTRFDYGRHPAPASQNVPLDWENDLEDLRYVGRVMPSAKEVKLFEECRSYGPWSAACADCEGEWKWANDRTAYQAEVEQKQQRLRERLAADERHYKERLKKLTWEKLLEEEPFARWIEHPPFPPPEFARAARDKIRATILDLRALGPKPKKSNVRAILKACVEWFNTIDAEFGNVIETEEREDICASLAELAFVAGHKSLVDDVEAWREW